MTFPLASGAYRYRPLKKGLSGWDVYALQTALNGIAGEEVSVDGIFGDLTDVRVRIFQRERKLITDGIAGVATQQKLTQVLGRKFRDGWQLPHGIPYGHLEHESSCLLGNHTPPYDDDSRDCGVTQRNTNYASIQDAFDAPGSIHVLCERVTTYHAKYVDWGVGERRAWELACGSWNAPAWTDRLAKGDSLSEPYRQRIEAYIASVTTYLKGPL